MEHDLLGRHAARLLLPAAAAAAVGGCCGRRGRRGCQPLQRGLDAGDVDGDEVLGDLGPLDGAVGGGGDVEDLGPQPANGDGAAVAARNRVSRVWEGEREKEREYTVSMWVGYKGGKTSVC